MTALNLSSAETLSPDMIAKITKLAAESAIAKYSWIGRGLAPIGYTKGMAVCFAQVYLKLKAGDSAALVMAAAVHESEQNDRTDALSWYNSNFRKIGMTNDVAGIDTLRHAFVLLMGLGMRESSGRYCEGRDISAGNIGADEAEAGLFQTSWNIRTASAELPKLFAAYKDSPEGFLSIFKEGVGTPTEANKRTYGSGEGAAFQVLTKNCPAFAVEVAAVGLRVRGGKTPVGHWGPIRRKEAELRPEADKLLQAVQALVDGIAGPITPNPLPSHPSPPEGGTPPAWPHEAQAGALDAFYGNPRGSGDSASAAWSTANLVKVVPPWRMTYEGKPVAAITIHRKCADSLVRVLNAIWVHYDRDQAKIDAVHLNEFDGSFAYRANRNNASKLSVHSYAAALDLAASENGNGKSWRSNAGMMPMAVVKIFAAEGWAWGGQFGGTKDAMHFQATFNPHASETLPNEVA